MITREGVHCDGCPDAQEFYGVSFKGMVNRIKAKGWRMIKRYQTWCHYCPACVENKRHMPNTNKRKISRPKREVWSVS